MILGNLRRKLTYQAVLVPTLSGPMQFEEIPEVNENEIEGWPLPEGCEGWSTIRKIRPYL